MIERFFNRYTYLLGLMLFLHVITLNFAGFVSYFDYIIIIFLLTMDAGNEDNYIWLSLLFGFFTDFTRDGFFGPGVILFLIVFLVRFRTDVIMDMTKVHYRVLLYAGVSLFYCFYNLIITDYEIYTALQIASVRTFLNLSAVFLVLSFFKGVRFAVKNP